MDIGFGKNRTGVSLMNMLYEQAFICKDGTIDLMMVPRSLRHEPSVEDASIKIFLMKEEEQRPYVKGTHSFVDEMD